MADPTPSPSPAPPRSPTLKRKRVSRACDQCFSKKDKCDGLHPLCTICHTLHRPCTYLRPLRKRGPASGLRPRLESHIARLETLLGYLVERYPAEAEAERGALDRVCAEGEERRARWREAWRRWDRGAREGLEPGRSGDGGGEGETERIVIPTMVPSYLGSGPASFSPVEEEEEGVEREVGRRRVRGGREEGARRVRGLVPPGTDPNEALGGFEMGFQHDEERWYSGVLAAGQRAEREGDGVGLLQEESEESGEEEEGESSGSEGQYEDDDEEEEEDESGQSRDGR